MEDNESQPTNVLDMIATDASPAEITDTLKSMLYAKSGERLEALKPYAAASVFGGEAPEAEEEYYEDEEAVDELEYEDEQPTEEDYE